MIRYTIMTIITLLLTTSVAVGQFSVNNTNGYLLLDEAQYNLDALVILNGIDANSTVKYTGNETNIEWTYSIAGENFNSTQKEIIPENATLYHLKVNGTTQYSLYVVDYTQYPLTINGVTIEETPEGACDNIILNIDATAAEIAYTDRNGVTRTIPREITLMYEDTEWKDNTWIDNAQEQSIVLPTSPITIKTPRKNTSFKLFGDNLAMEMGVNIDTVFSDYTTPAVEIHIIGTVAEREYTNEKDRSSPTEIDGSGPLVVEFTSNANPVDLVYYEWLVAKVETPNNYQRYNDVNLRYTFEDTGEYTVKLVGSNNVCNSRDSINVKVTTSMLQAPNVFTPNGDGMNDEWRVAYRSIERYSCIIQNRWGRTVFRSDNPGKGWDGTINGRPAAEGTYYYSIVAYGTDLDIKGKQMKYKLDGDINLIR